MAPDSTDHPQFGPLLKQFGPNLTPFYILLGVGVLTTLIASLMGVGAIADYHSPPSVLDELSTSFRKDGLVTGLAIAGFNLCVGLGCFVAAWFQKSVRLDIFTGGLVSQRGRQQISAVWDDVAEVIEIKHVNPSNRRVKRYEVVVKIRNGTDILLRGITAVRRAGETIAQQCGLSVKRR